MTNQEILFRASQKLAKEGKIGYTGRVFKAEINGKEITVNREWIRYNRCLAAGMSEREAGKALG